MSLSGGTRIGAYDVVSLLGEGGMGQVYRARDSRLDRDVAIKVLPESFARDPDRLARFEREAKLLASLNHPHIAHVYGLEDNGSTRALVMELVEGPTLAERLREGALPMDEALRLARQLAAGLEAAHDQGIIHRDLKPANIKLRPDGSVKVLDFGLAKLADASPSSAGSALTSPGMTRAGIVLGTPAYMSPEQARGQAVDARTDLWAFGVVCFEMLTGRRAFDGDTASDAISAVLTREPAWEALPAHTPAAVRRLLRRCLARDLTRRVRHAGDVRLELEELDSADPAEDAARPSPSKPATSARVPWMIAAAASLAALWFGWQAWNTRDARGQDATPTTRLEFTLPPGLELFPSTASTVVASPDGRSVGFVGTSGDGRLIFLRRLDGFESTPVKGTQGATTFTFTADGASIAFVTSGGDLRTVSLADGLVTTITKGASLLYGVTTTTSDLVFVRGGALWTVPRGAGEARQLTTLGANEYVHAWPSALPDERTLLFTVDTSDGARVEALTLATGERRLVLNRAARAKIGPEGRLFFYRDNSLLATAFDATALRASGPPLAVLENVPDLGGGSPVGDVSPAGLMVFAPGSPQRRLVFVSRQGVEEAVADTGRSYMNPRISPDGNRVVVQSGSIWVHDLRRNAIERVSTLNTAANAFPMWLPDGVTVLHRSGVGIRVQSTESGRQGHTLSGTSEFDYPTSVTADGKMLVFNRSSPDTSFDVLIAPFADFKSAVPLVQTPAYEAGARISPDSRWLTYVSNDSGRNEVYLRPFRGADWRRQVSTDGGTQPVWNPKGREVFYRIGDRMMSVGVTATGEEVRLSSPQQVFARGYSYGAGITMANYDVTADGQRFLMVRDDTTIGRLRVILNWTAAGTGATTSR